MTEALVSTGSRVLDEIAGVIGTRAALVLGCAFRGERVYIPKDPAREPRIAEAIGEELARALCDVMGGTPVSVPVRVVLHHAVKQHADAGMTRRDIARHLKIREAQVYEILKRWREDERQPRLL